MVVHCADDTNIAVMGLYDSDRHTAIWKVDINVLVDDNHEIMPTLQVVPLHH